MKERKFDFFKFACIFFIIVYFVARIVASHYPMYDYTGLTGDLALLFIILHLLF